VRVHGRRGRVYVALDGDVAEPVAYLNKWDFAITGAPVEVTARGDANKVWLSKKPEITGSFAGFYDQLSASTYENTAAGVAKRFYLYPNSPAPGTHVYFFGTAIFDFSAEGSVDAAVSVSSSWAAESFWKLSADGGFSDGFSDGFSKAVI